MKIGKNLIITGWGHLDYAAAAAVALRHCAAENREATVLGVSKNRLPELLAQQAQEKNRPNQILIIGVSLAGDPDRLASACQTLHDSGVALTFYSTIVWNDAFFTRFNGSLQVVMDDDLSLHQLVARELKVEQCEDLDEIFRKPDGANGKKSRLYLDAASCHYRNYQDLDAYADAIRFLASPNDRVSSALTSVVKDYQTYHAREWLGTSEISRNLRDTFKKIGQSGDCRVLIHGETGTGKETAALLIRGHSARRDKSFVTFNCAVLTPHMLESQLFGHEKGAFTGAVVQREGAFEQADGGTLFLDEVGELPPEAQAGLLRVLQEGRFCRLGGTKEIAVNVRVIVATHRDLPAMVRAGTFREDLFYRLSVVPLHLPPLRERPADLAALANAHWRTLNGSPALTSAQHAALASYHWPGNVRELRNLLERAQILGVTDFTQLLDGHRHWLAGSVEVIPKGSGTVPGADWAPPPAPGTPPKSAPNEADPETLATVTRRHVRAVVAHYGGNLAHASHALGLTRNTVKKHLAAAD